MRVFQFWNSWDVSGRHFENIILSRKLCVRMVHTQLTTRTGIFRSKYLSSSVQSCMKLILLRDCGLRWFFLPIRFFLGKRFRVKIYFVWFENFMSIGVFSIYDKILMAYPFNTFIFFKRILCACLNTFVIFGDDFE